MSIHFINNINTDILWYAWTYSIYMLAEYRRLKGLATLASRNYIQVGGGRAYTVLSWLTLDLLPLSSRKTSVISLKIKLIIWEVLWEECTTRRGSWRLFLSNYYQGNWIFCQGNVREFQSWSSVATMTERIMAFEWHWTFDGYPHQVKWTEQWFLAVCLGNSVYQLLCTCTDSIYQGQNAKYIMIWKSAI